MYNKIFLTEMLQQQEETMFQSIYEGNHIEGESEKGLSVYMYK